MKNRLIPALIGAVSLIGLGATAAQAGCLPPGAARDVIARGEAMPLVEAARAARDAIDGEIIGGRLCSDGAGYVYMMTLLSPDGRVSRVTVDALSGAVLSVR